MQVFIKLTGYEGGLPMAVPVSEIQLIRSHEDDEGIYASLCIKSEADVSVRCREDFQTVMDKLEMALTLSGGGHVI